MSDCEKTRERLLEELGRLRQRLAALEAPETPQREPDHGARAILDSAPVGICQCDAEGRIIYVNPAQEAVTGYSAAELRGKHIWDHVQLGPEKAILVVYLKRLVCEQPSPQPYFAKGVRKDGEPFDLRVDWNYTRNERGELIGFVAVLTDITQQRPLEEALRESEQRYRYLAESTTDLIYIINRSGDILYANRSAAACFGCDPTSIVGKRQTELFPPELAERHLASVDGVFRTGKVFENDSVYRFGGQEVWLNTRLMPIRDERGRVTAVMGVSRNITDRKQTEAALKLAHDELEKRVEERTAELARAKREWERTFDSVPDLLAVLDRSSRIVRVNRAMAERLGATPEQCVGLKCCEVVHGLSEPPEQCPNALTLADSKGHKVEMHESRLGGDFLVTTTPIFDDNNQLIGSVHVARDVTEQRQAQRALQESEAKYRGLIDICPDAIVVSDLTGTATFVSPQTWKLLGVPEEVDLVGRSTLDYVIEADRPKLAARIESLLKVGKQEHTQYTCLRPDGTMLPVELSSAVIRNAEGTPVALLAIIRDISDRKRAEEELRQSEEKYRSLVELCPDAVVVTDLNIETIFVSRQAWRLLDLPEQVELIGRNAFEFVVEADRPRLAEKIAELAQTGRQKHIEYTVQSPNGLTAPVEISSAVIPDAEGKPVAFMAVVRDISERKEAQEALRREHRTLKHLLESSDHERRLIAYDIHDGLAQQLAGAIMQFETYDFQRKTKPKEAKKTFETALSMLRKTHFEARRLIGGVRPPILDESGVVAAIAHLVNEHRLQNGPTIELESNVSFDRLVPIQENAIYRIVQEGLSNACNHSQSPKVRVELMQRDETLRVKIQDWGVGFDPRTVKEDRFGLEGIRERARLLGGKADVKTTAGQGTCLDVELPLAFREESK
jgi:PAS domain S-box-containing protein